jgi:hypothetical protein
MHLTQGREVILCIPGLGAGTIQQGVMTESPQARAHPQQWSNWGQHQGQIF